MPDDVRTISVPMLGFRERELFASEVTGYPQSRVTSRRIDTLDVLPPLRSVIGKRNTIYNAEELSTTNDVVYNVPTIVCRRGTVTFVVAYVRSTEEAVNTVEMQERESIWKSLCLTYGKRCKHGRDERPRISSFGIVSTSDYGKATRRKKEQSVFDEERVVFVRNWICFTLLRLSKT
jgi:hypothetical protein